MMHYWGNSSGWGGWLIMGIAMLAFLAFGAMLLARYAGGRGDGPRRGPDSDKPGVRAREILDERYARGEIGDDEYRTRRETLSAR